MSSVQWAGAGFFIFGLAAHLFLDWYLPYTPPSDYWPLVAATAVAGSVAGSVLSRRRSRAKDDE